MAVVNPPIQPTNDPSFGANSRAIDTPEPIRVQGVQQNQIMPKGVEVGDRSAEFEGQATAYGMQGQAVAQKGIGDLFAGIVGIGDFLAKGGVHLVKKDIENQVYEVANREREAYTAELEKIKAGGVNNILDANASMDEPVPDEVSELPDTLASLRGARDAGKITKTDYAGRLLAEAKKLRAQYPGFKNEIDTEFAKVTGMNPANARVNGLISEINRAAAANSSATNKTETFIRAAIKDGVPRSDEYLAKFRAGLMPEMEVYREIGKYNQAKERLQLRDLENKDRTRTREEDTIKGRNDADYGLGVVVASASDSLLGKLGLTDPAAVEALNNQQKAGTIPAQKWAELNQITANEYALLRTKMLADMDRTGTTKRVGGKAEAIKLVDASLEPIRTIQDRIVNKDFGGIYSASKENTAILDDTKNSILKHSKAGPITRLLGAQKDLIGEQYLQKLNLEMALGKDGIPSAIKEWYNRFSYDLETQNSKDKNAGKANTFNDVAYEMKSIRELNDPILQAKAMGGLVKKVEKIGMKEVPDQVKVNIIEAAFSTGNARFLSKLNMDGFDERGRPVSGMNAVFQKWTAPEITKEVKRLSEKNPELWSNYSNWAKETFGNELLNRELNDLSKFNKDPNVNIIWDSTNKRFDVSRTDVAKTEARRREDAGGTGYNTSESLATSQQFQTVSRAINRINSGLYNLKNVAKEDGSDVDAYLLRTVQDAAGKETLSNVSGIPWQMLNQVILGNAYANSKRK